MTRQDTTMEADERQERRDRKREKERTRMVVHRVKSPRTGERLVKVVVGRARKARGLKPAASKLRSKPAA